MAAQNPPQEVLDLIFDHFDSQSDHQNLRRCSLVCSSWLASTRRSLPFRKVTVTTANVDDFTSLLMSPFSTFPHCINTLNLSVNAKWFRRLIPFLQILSTIRSLEIKDLDWTLVEPYNRTRFSFMLLGNLKHLSLGTGTTFHSLTEVLDFISQYKNLERLSIDGISWKSLDTPPSSSLTGDWGLDSCAKGGPSSSAPYPLIPPSVQYFQIGDCQFRQLFSRLMMQPSVPAIPHLSFRNVGPEDTIQLFDYIMSIKHSIKSLTVSYHVNCFGGVSAIGSDVDGMYSFLPVLPEGAPNAQGLDFKVPCENQHPTQTKTTTVGSRCSRYEEGNIGLPALRTVCIDNFIYYSDPTRTAALFYGPCQLGAHANGMMKAPALRSVTLNVKLKKAGDVDLHVVDWRRLDEILIALANTCGSLGDKSVSEEETLKIVFEVRGGADVHAFASLIVGRLPLSQAEGLLRFS